jgi:phenylacetate-CoA ligase
MDVYQIPKLFYPHIPKVSSRWKRALELKKMHYWPQAKIDEYIEEKKKNVLRHAATKVPYYANIFRERGWNPECAEKYWAEWPILTQELLQTHRDEILSTDTTAEDMVLDASGGSSGLVKTFYHAPEYKSYSLSSAYHTDSIAGWTPGCKTAYLWAAPCDTKEHLGIFPRMKSFLQNIKLYDSFDMGEAQMEKFHHDLSLFRPEVIIGIAGSVFQMARFLKERGVTPSYPSKGIVTSAETLTEEMRSMIESVFGPIIFNRYGCREVGLIAFEDEAHSGLHIDFPGNLVEVCEPNTTNAIWNQEGDILITTLTQTLFPLIRYQVGDMAIQTHEKCSCGRNSPILSKVSGRNSDFITATNGRRIHGEYFSHILRVGEKIRQYTVIQSKTNFIRIELVLSEPFTEQEHKKIIDEFCNTLGKDMKIEFKEVDHIPPLPSGKRRFVISLL